MHSEKTGNLKSFTPPSNTSSSRPMQPRFSNPVSLGKILLSRHLRSPSRPYHRRTRTRAGPSPLRQNATADPIILPPPPTAHCPPISVNPRELRSWMASDKTLYGYNPYDYVNSELRRNRLRKEELDAMDAIEGFEVCETVVPPRISSESFPVKRASHRYAIVPDKYADDVPRVLLQNTRKIKPEHPQSVPQTPEQRRTRQPLAQRQQVGPWNGVVGYKTDSKSSDVSLSLKQNLGRGRGLPRAARPPLRVRNKENYF
ncbi:hypothetical protein K435DRAFT_359742 [Dendrothele bispora CBS 962.96]|uniref:Uncharacterized protein n=1 Tax=Dendrothele bispora (strain CBS 962.96) TaxID=1314807 RepID=A0A4S8LDF2_DENBC|nr:hypothetical protein K435DRAFT_359742 [Dendrothele bispora CBS 962.96]